MRVEIDNVSIGQGEPLAVIAGPCVIEAEKIVFEIAERLADISKKASFPLIFKASFDKANRTSIDSYRGPGRKKGLAVLCEVKKRFGIPVTTDIHTVEDAAACAETVDLIQIPAFLCRQTDILVAAGETGLPVNVKKGQFLAPDKAKSIIKKVTSTGNHNVMITERGSSFGYGSLVNDFAAVPELRKLDCPLVFDVTHSVQMPGSGGNVTGGRAEAIPTLARCAAAAGFDALFFEVHPDPANALSDAQSMIKLDEFAGIINEILPFASLTRKNA